MPWFDQYVAHYDGVQGGAAVVVETRTPVRTIVAKYRTHGGNVDTVMRNFPHLTETEIRAALAYYETQRVEVDADTERHQRALHALGASVAS
jgi:uncharacterized protein (DUF433 family)